jgi:RNA polymerase sigma factor (sigma-70 family)
MERPIGLERCPDEDSSFIDALYRGQASALSRTRHARSMRDEPLDLVHDAFVRLLGLGPARLRVIAAGKPGAYLGRIARNIGVDHARRESRRTKVATVPLHEVDPEGYDVERQLEARDDLRRVERAVLAMRPRTRAIFLAHRVDGMSYAEIAEECGIGIKGVEKQMGRAIAILARELDDD